ncbi:MAG: DUF3192 domain-containing protein [Halieaceae bacterium]|jgi:hypothetical protein|nr:DUF3192 domain-containing protein [Halieaceae bacterium]
MKRNTYPALLPLVAAMSTAMLLNGCVIIDGDTSHLMTRSSWEKEQEKNREAIASLAIGMERGEVMQRLGSPAYSEAFTEAEDEYRVLFYRTQRLHGDGETTRDETTPLVFRNDTLMGWGDSVYQGLR